jgi:hypothetical protein
MNEKIIYKWGPLNLKPFPIKGRVVHVGLQGSDGNVFVWTENHIATVLRDVERMVRLYPTGHTYIGEYHGTVVMPSGLVWHVIEEDGP